MSTLYSISWNVQHRIVSTLGFSCLWWKKQAWLICYSRKAPTPSLHPPTRRSMDWPQTTLSYWKVSTLQKRELASRHIRLSFNHSCFVSWMAGDVNALRVILLYHFSNGIFINGGLERGVTNMLKTLQGKNLRVFSVCIPTDIDYFVLRNSPKVQQRPRLL